MTTAPQTEKWRPPDSCRPPLDDQRLDFVERAARFADENKNELPFRFLRLFARCADDELAQLLSKLYCETYPEFYGRHETLAESVLKVLAQPLKFLLTKKFLWRRQSQALFDLELINPAHLADYYRRIYESLPAPKRISPSDRPQEFPGSETVDPVSSSATLRSLLWLSLAPLCLPSLWRLSRRCGRNLLAPFRRALGTYALFDGHFRRYPCRHFISYDDVLNHPCRYLAFKQNCPGKLIAVQNGNRSYHPVHAFGMLDVYLSFGRYMRRLAPGLKLKAARIEPVGCLNLDRWHALRQELCRGPREPLYDVLFLDQGLWPFNGQDQRTGRTAYEKIFRNLNELKRRRPGWRIAVQMRGYAGHVEHEALVRRTHARFFTEPIEILENTDQGESYRSVFRARLVLTATSTLGYEAFFFGNETRTLFVNYAGNPYDYCSLDPRFQLYDETADYEAFERNILELQALRLQEPPAVALDQHEVFDGRTQERIAALLCGRDFLA